MEKTQTNGADATRRVEPGLTDAAVRAAPVELNYLNAAEFERHQVLFGGRLLGAVAFSAARPAIVEPACPYAWVDMPVLAGEAVVEVWTSAQTVKREQEDGLNAAYNADLLFGCL